MISTVDIISNDLINSEASSEAIRTNTLIAQIVDDYGPIFYGVQDNGFDILWDCYVDGIKDRIQNDNLGKEALVVIKRACKN